MQRSQTVALFFLPLLVLPKEARRCWYKALAKWLATNNNICGKFIYFCNCI
jgi:hypothetical protein